MLALVCLLGSAEALPVADSQSNLLAGSKPQTNVASDIAALVNYMEYPQFVEDVTGDGEVCESGFDALGHVYDVLIGLKCRAVLTSAAEDAHPTIDDRSKLRKIRRLCRVHKNEMNGIVEPPPGPTALPCSSTSLDAAGKVDQTGPLDRHATPCDGTPKVKGDDKPMHRSTATPH